MQAIGRWLKEHGVETVAMESTGVYWIPLFEELERHGFECLLISSRSMRRVAGRMSDIEDAQWIQNQVAVSEKAYVKVTADHTEGHLDLQQGYKHKRDSRASVP